MTDIFEEDFHDLIQKIKIGSRCGGIMLSARECDLLTIRLKSSIDLLPVIDLLSKTLNRWKEEDNKIKEMIKCSERK